MNHSDITICHLTSVHPRNDTRIFLKMCRSIAAHGYNTVLIVADGQGDESVAGVHIYDVGAQPGRRIQRMIQTTRRIFRRAVLVDANIYHIHDPELIITGLQLQRRGHRVIFDSHEDVAADILDKTYLASPLRKSISFLYSVFEQISCKYFDAIIGATPWIRDKLRVINPNTYDINNYPVIDEFNDCVNSDWSNRHLSVCYIGGIYEISGVVNVIHAMDLCNSAVTFDLAGHFTSEVLRDNIQQYKGWSNVRYHGYLRRSEAVQLMSTCRAGIVTYKPAANHIAAQPNKMFEYMSAGIPVIASNFPLWRSIIEDNNCGICVDPLNPNEIAAAIDIIITDEYHARQMGENGRKMILERYNWAAEERKLLNIYENLLGVH